MPDVVSGHAVGATLTLRDAVVTEAVALTELALRSKSVWGYSADFMERCRPLLTVSERYVEENTVVVAERAGRIAGFHAIVPLDGGLSLDLLYVDPAYRGVGAGRLLLDDALARARAVGLPLHVESDPNAESFYMRHGAERVGLVESPAEPGRMLPVLVFHATSVRITMGQHDIT